MITLIARQIGRRITQHWVNKDAGPVQPEVIAWAKEQWDKRQLQADRLLIALKAACQTALANREPEDIFDGFVDDITLGFGTSVEYDLGC